MGSSSVLSFITFSYALNKNHSLMALTSQGDKKAKNYYQIALVESWWVKGVALLGMGFFGQRRKQRAFSMVVFVAITFQY